MTAEEKAKTKGEADDYFDTHILPLLEEERRLKKKLGEVEDERSKHQREHLRLTKLWITLPE